MHCFYCEIKQFYIGQMDGLWSSQEATAVVCGSSWRLSFFMADTCVNSPGLVKQLTLREPMWMDYEGHVNVLVSGSGVFTVLFVYYLVDVNRPRRVQALTLRPSGFLLSLRLLFHTVMIYTAACF